MKDTDTASAIIDAEFGGQNGGKTNARDCFWWKEMLSKINKLCKTSAEDGYKNCQDIHKERLLMPEKPNTDCIHLSICKYYEKK